MKLLNVKAKLMGMRSKAVRALAIAAVAGTALAVAAPAAQAQRMFVSVRPRVVVPARVVVVRPGFYYGPRYHAWARAHRYERFRR
ncbi:MAG TPA: hypothetical protein VHY48_08505 [Acidobacteriaceae bacterium]|jgi:hypothetical protein|nr:hypothetical protein [Acidobacteriaceae bacterium]